ncbi:MAG: VanZ family protein [Clostridiales bacterium]|nr:VanZ family protein [Clostridiales bacterium]
MYLENNEVKKYPIRTILAWTSVVIWMAVIFMFSNQSADDSSQLSTSLTETLVRLLDSQASDAVVQQAESIVRTVAHGLVFFVLGLLLSWSFSEMATPELLNALLSFIIGALYAASDELHQSFVPGRASQWSDFLVDLAGIVLAILIYQVVMTLRFLRQDLRVKREEDLRI